MPHAIQCGCQNAAGPVVCPVVSAGPVHSRRNGRDLLVYFATTNPLLQTSVSEEMPGRVMGIFALVSGGLMPVGRSALTRTRLQDMNPP
jgi:hypothetical protein